MSRSPAQELVALIAQAVDDIEADTSSQIPGAATTKLNLPVIAREDALKVTPRRREAVRKLKAATQQLLATLLPTGLYFWDLHDAYFQNVAIYIALQAQIADIIHALDPDSSEGGICINVLAEKSGIDARKLSNILRFLAIHHIFCELKEEHWANNRLSMTLRSDSANSLKNFIPSLTEEIAIPALLEFPEVLFNKQLNLTHSWDPRDAPTPRYFKFDGNFFEHLDQTGGGHRAERFGKAMMELTKITRTDSAQYLSFDWCKLGDTGVLVDVGGGIGITAGYLATYLPNWSIIVQERPEVVREASKQAQQNQLESSKPSIEFEVADFFREQPAHRFQGCDVYFLRHILHNWSVELCISILSNLRKAAKPTTRLLICEADLKPPLVDSNSLLLSNGGMATSLAHHFNLVMMVSLNAAERSAKEYEEIFRESGWKLIRIHPLMNFVEDVIFEGIVDSEKVLSVTNPM